MNFEGSEDMMYDAQILILESNKGQLELVAESK